MAIQQAVRVAVASPASADIRAITDLDGSEFVEGSSSAPTWAKYLEAVVAEIGAARQARGARIAVISDLPETGGLSSSSAFTVACVLALSHLWELELDGAGVVATAVRAERRAAIAGGAMDQTVIALARPGHALRIDFDPYATRHVAAPDDFRWVAGFSGTAAPKGGSVAAHYNAFVLASRAAASLLGDTGDPPLLSRVRTTPPHEVAKLPTISAATAADIAGGQILGVAPDWEIDLAVAAGHVLSEAGRVDAAEGALLSADIAHMGRLMDDSHASLRLYGSSTPQLDSLVVAARHAGAFGARVTGAGFGGWGVALTQPDAVQSVRAAMEAATGGPTFVAEPSGGALWASTGQ